MATTLFLKFDPTKQDLTTQAREILEKRGTYEVVTISDPALLLEIERVNQTEVECKLDVRWGDEQSSYGYSLSEELKRHAAATPSPLATPPSGAGPDALGAYIAAATNRWMVFFCFSRALYLQIFSEQTSEGALAYLRANLPEMPDREQVLLCLWTNTTACSYFTSEEEARAVFSQAPEGGVLHAELFDSQGVSLEDNT